MKKLTRQATALQIARYGHIALALKDWMKANKQMPPDINRALGKRSVNPGVYNWLRGLGAPDRANRAKLMRITGIPEQMLTAREAVTPTAKQLQIEAPTLEQVLGMEIEPARAAQAAKRVAEVLSFTALDNGEARIRLDVTLPIEQAMPLFRQLLDASALMQRSVGGDDHG